MINVSIYITPIKNIPKAVEVQKKLPKNAHKSSVLNKAIKYDTQTEITSKEEFISI